MAEQAKKEIKDLTKPFIDKALDILRQVYPDIQEIHLADDVEIGVDIQDGESVYIFYSTFYERGQKFGGPISLRNERYVVSMLMSSTLRHKMQQEDEAFRTLTYSEAQDLIQNIIDRIYPE